MAHRQTYKEEPGVAVTGDHVSTQRLFLRVVTIDRILHLSWNSRIRVIGGYTVQSPLLHKPHPKFASRSLLDWLQGIVHGGRGCGFDVFSKITSEPGSHAKVLTGPSAGLDRWRGEFVGSFHNL